jgi:hypothetical protein
MYLFWDSPSCDSIPVRFTDALLPQSLGKLVTGKLVTEGRNPVT